jgi:hypothetical protein
MNNIRQSPFPSIPVHSRPFPSSLIHSRPFLPLFYSLFYIIPFPPFPSRFLFNPLVIFYPFAHVLLLPTL